jgi:predicted enzyme related to lactoylglutathione lyase
MGNPVVRFEVIGKDGKQLRDYYSQLFGWDIDAGNPMDYGIVNRDGNTDGAGLGIGGGIGTAHAGGAGHVTFYVAVPDVEAALAKATSLRVLLGEAGSEQRSSAARSRAQPSLASTDSRARG